MSDIKRFWEIVCVTHLLAALAIGPLAADEKPAWIPISQEVTAQVKPGYPGKTAGVTVDPANGELYMVVVGKQGFHETTDAGQTWQLAASLPPEFGVGLVGPNYAWDPHANIFYASSMGKDTFKLERPAK